MVNSPSNSTFGPSAYPTSAWSIPTWQRSAACPDITLSGVSNGEPDANGVWHNARYYSYTVATQTLSAGGSGCAGAYFVFSPDASSQTQGYIVISQTTLQSNLSPGRPGHDDHLGGQCLHPGL